MTDQMDFDDRPENAPKRFELKCQNLMAHSLDDKLEGHAIDQIAALLTYFGACFGVTRQEMQGDPNAETDVGRTGLSRLLAHAWSEKRKVGTNPGTLVGGRGFKPAAVIHGLRRALDLCQSMPTEGLLAEIIRGGDGAHYPGGMLKGQEPPPPPLKTEGAIQGKALAEEFELESEKLGLHPDRATPDQIALDRLAEIKALMGLGWGRVPATADEEVIQERRERFKAAALEDENNEPGDDCPL